MKLGQKPLAQMTTAEMEEAIAALRAEREGLLEDARQRAAAREAKGLEAKKEPRVKREVVSKKKEADDLLAKMLALGEEPEA